MTAIRGKVVVVTGAGSGIGRALARDLVRRGAHVALSDIDDNGLQVTRSLLDAKTNVTTHVVDVRDWAAMQQHAADVSAAHGGADIVINNAGLTVNGTIEDMPYDDFKLVLDVNLWGVIHGTKAFFPLLRARPEAHIVNIASINAMVPFVKNGPYNVSKYAVYGLNETLMQELAGSTIRITSVHPGGIRTNIVRNAKGHSSRDAALFDKLARTSAEQAATTIIKGIERNTQRLFVGADAKLMAAAKRLIPALTVRAVGAASARAMKRSK
jgi:NAD(P)-dependent dehydrogenase (short-subunit alcohol dehydrogenase family)